MILAALVPLLLVASGPLPAEDVRFRNGELELAAELLLPDELPGPAAAVVIVQGSGDSDRSNGWSAAIAELFKGQGLVVLLTDKRGCGASKGDWRMAGFEDLAADTLAGVEFLRQRPEVDPARVGVVGLSQGGWIVPIAAARAPVGAIAFVVDVSGAAVGFAEQVNLEMANTARQAGLGPDGVAQVLAMNRAASRYALAGDWAAYAAARERGLNSKARAVVAGFPDSADAPRWEFIRRVGMFDPMPYWTVVEPPVLVVYGELDEEDNVPVGESVRRLEHAFAVAAKENATIEVIAGAGHGLLDREHGGLMPAFVETVAVWLAENVSR